MRVPLSRLTPRSGALLAALLSMMCTTSPARSTPVRFHFRPATPAHTVTVAGTFNGWSVAEFRLADPDTDGVWDGLLDLAPGRYRYKFVVDGERWYTDRTASAFEADDFGGQNSVLLVGDLPCVAGSPADSPDQVPMDGGAPRALRPYLDGEPMVTLPHRGPGTGPNGGMTPADFARHEMLALPIYGACSSIILAPFGGYVSAGLMGSLSLRMLVFREPGTGNPRPAEAVLAYGLLALTVADIVLEANHTHRAKIFWINFAGLMSTDLLAVAVSPGNRQQGR